MDGAKAALFEAWTSTELENFGPDYTEHLFLYKEAKACFLRNDFAMASEYCDHAKEATSEAVNTGKFSEADESRALFTQIGLLEGLIALDKGETANALKCLDMVLLLGTPNEKIARAADIVAEKLSEEVDEVQDVSEPWEDSRRDFESWKDVDVVEEVDCPAVETFWKNNMWKEEPVKLLNTVEHFPARSKWTMPYLLNVAGQRTVPVELGHDYTHPHWTQQLLPLGTFIRRHLLESSPVTGYLAQHSLFVQIPRLMDDLLIPDYCSSTPDINIWLGPKGTVSPLHFDPKHNLLTQVRGHKRVLLFPPQQEGLYTFSPECLMSNTSQVDPEKPDLERFPLFKSANGLACLLGPGDVLYIPPKWWHHVRSLSASLSVSYCMLSIATWNINGIRSFSKQQLHEALAQIDADIICLQETKITRDVLDEQTATFDGYTSFFSFSQTRSGYSGVATICRNHIMPVKAEEGISGQLVRPNCTDNVGVYGAPKLTDERLKQLDSEGRSLITQFELKNGKMLLVINVYCPRADPDRYEERLSFKLDFYQMMECRAQALRASGHHVIILGDLNTSHKLIDHCDPGDQEEFESNLGRLWMDRIIVDSPAEADFDRLQMMDSFRTLHPERREAFTCWNTQKNARSTNYGTRIDYILFTPLLASALADCDIMPQVHGSDHCPVRAEFKIECAPPGAAPSLCSKNLFAGRQQKLHSFFTAKPKPEPTENKLPTQSTKNGVRKQASLMGFLQKKEPKVEGTFQYQEFCSSEAPKNTEVANAWKGLLSGPRPVPFCEGHGEPSVVRTVKKPGPNLNKQFYCCARGEGHKDNPEGRCNFFQWVKK